MLAICQKQLAKIQIQQSQIYYHTSNYFNLVLFKMLSISENQVLFKTGEMLKALIIKNHSDLSVIFKIKTNKRDYIDSKPNMGIIPKEKCLQLIIKAANGSSFQAKLQISYAAIEQQLNIGDANILNEQWNKVPKDKIQSIVINVKKEQSFLDVGQQKVSTKFHSLLIEEKKQSMNSVSQTLKTQKVQAKVDEKVSQVSSRNKDVFESTIKNQEPNKFIQPMQKKQQKKPNFQIKPQKQVEVAYHKIQQKKPKQKDTTNIKDSPAVININLFKLIGMFLVIFIVGHLHGRNSVDCSSAQIITKNQQHTKNTSKQKKQL